MIGKPFSYKDYEDFYAQNFNKVELPKRNTLFEPADLNEPREPEKVQPIGIPEVDNQPVTSEAGETRRRWRWRTTRSSSPSRNRRKW